MDPEKKIACGEEKGATLRYQDEFLHDWTLICTRIENGLKLGDQLKQALEERASLEEKYSIGLERISSKIFPPATESTSMASAIKALRNETYRRSQQCRDLCDTLRSDVLCDTLNNMLENHKSAYDHLFSSGKRIASELQRRYTNFTKLRDNYGIARHNIGQLSLRYHELSRKKSSQEKITMLGGEILRKILELNDMEKEYMNSVDSFDAYHKFYLTEMKHIIDILEDMDTKRIKCISDTLMKVMIYDMSYIRNLQYDSDYVIKSLQEIDVEGDINEFASRFGNSNNTDNHENSVNNLALVTGNQRIDASQVKKESWREICRHMNNIKISDDEFITLSTSQMAEKNIALDNIVDIQTIISNLVNPVTAIKAQKAVKVLFSQFNMIINEGARNYTDESYLNDTEFHQEMDAILEKDEKSHSMESFSTACSAEVATSKNKDKAPDGIPNSVEGFTDTSMHEKVDFQSVYKSFIETIVKLDENNKHDSKEVVDKALSIINNQEVGLAESNNCDYYLSIIIDEILKREGNKLHLYLGEELCQVLFKHMNMIMELIQNESNTWLFRKMLFISESLIVDESELFSVIYKHDVWSVVKIWEETILLCISEQFQRGILESDSTELERFRMLKNIRYFDALNNVDNLSSLMKRFGIPEIPIITLFTKVCSQNGLEKSYCDRLIHKIKNIK
ncbi:FCH domain-containing protein [Cryptosporidium canis]|uniref:FCH domain-containing protein n=1 Tax=Cryptosporidium canis TaxID=195482 RepID=A0ABQ8P6Q3_9CRYT|nr:FCH domain-containing protein [Cryptosporidium canis]